MHSTTTSRIDHDHREGEARLSRRAMLAGSAGAALALQVPRSLLAAQSTPDAGGVPALTIPIYPHGSLISLDPHSATNWGPHWVMLPHVWAGLMGFDENGAVVPVLASTIEPEEDGRIWVATIRSEAAFASGNPVTADALIQGWTRALDPLRLSPMSSYMRRVEGFDAFIAREQEALGFEARDEMTVAIRLTEPYSLFPEDLATFVWAAVDVTALEGLGTAEVPFAGASAGPWQFVTSDDPSVIRMQPAPNASNIPSTVASVAWTLMDGPQAAETALEQYRGGSLAIADMPSPLRSTIAEDAALQAELQTVEQPGSTMLIGMDFRQAPFDNPDVRRAVASAIDRERWATEIMQGTFVPATAITPPVLMQTANYSPPQPLAFNADEASSLVAGAGIDAESMPLVTYYQPATSSEAEIEQAAALLAMIQENCGLVIEHDTTLTEEQIDALRRDNDGLQFDIRWWWPLTSSPSGLAEIGLPDSNAMARWFNWSSSLENEDVAAAADQFATLIADAQATMDQTERQQLFAQAEELLVQQVVYVPLGHWVQAWLQSPGLAGTRQGAFTGYVPVALDEAVTWQPTEGTPTG